MLKKSFLEHKQELINHVLSQNTLNLIPSIGFLWGNKVVVKKLIKEQSKRMYTAFNEVNLKLNQLLNDDEIDDNYFDDMIKALPWTENKDRYIALTINGKASKEGYFIDCDETYTFIIKCLLDKNNSWTITWKLNY